MTTVEMAEKKGDFIRAVIRARRKAVAVHDRAIPTKPATIVAKEYNIDLDVAKSAVRNLDDEHDQGRAVLGRRRRSTWKA